jgi:formyltetrahydrofolate hydrolase
MDWRVSYTDASKSMLILVSRYDHCLIDLLWRWDAGELDAEIPLVISNHPNLSSRAELCDIPFHHLPVTKETKAEQESAVLDLLSEHAIDLVVLARAARCYLEDRVLVDASVPSSLSKTSFNEDGYTACLRHGGFEPSPEQVLQFKPAPVIVDYQ